MLQLGAANDALSSFDMTYTHVVAAAANKVSR